MKKNIVLRIAAVVLMLSLVTACFASSTFAKYTSAGKADSIARVARWSITMDGKDLAIAGDDALVSFNLFDTIYDTNGGATETDVKAGSDVAIIAPGTKGAFTFDNITNASEVTAKIDIYLDKVELSDTTLPIQFTKGSTTLSASETTPIFTKTLAAGETFEITDAINWVWAFDGSDTVDTALGVKGTDTVQVFVRIVATQVD